MQRINLNLNLRLGEATNWNSRGRGLKELLWMEDVYRRSMYDGVGGSVERLSRGKITLSRARAHESEMGTLRVEIEVAHGDSPREEEISNIFLVNSLIMIGTRLSDPVFVGKVEVVEGCTIHLGVKEISEYESRTALAKFLEQPPVISDAPFPTVGRSVYLLDVNEMRTLDGAMYALELEKVKGGIIESFLDPPSFVPPAPILSSPGWRESCTWHHPYLDDGQQAAVISAVEGTGRKVPFLIVGPPASGKTTTIVEIIAQILEGRSSKKDGRSSDISIGPDRGILNSDDESDDPCTSLRIMVCSPTRLGAASIARCLGDIGVTTRSGTDILASSSFLSAHTSEYRSMDMRGAAIANSIQANGVVVCCTLQEAAEMALRRMVEHTTRFQTIILDDANSMCESLALSAIAPSYPTSKRDIFQLIVSGDPFAGPLPCFRDSFPHSVRYYSSILSHLQHLPVYNIHNGAAGLDMDQAAGVVLKNIYRGPPSTLSVLARVCSKTQMRVPSTASTPVSASPNSSPSKPLTSPFTSPSKPLSSPNASFGTSISASLAESPYTSPAKEKSSSPFKSSHSPSLSKQTTSSHSSLRTSPTIVRSTHTSPARQSSSTGRSPSPSSSNNSPQSDSKSQATAYDASAPPARIDVKKCFFSAASRPVIFHGIVGRKVLAEPSHEGFFNHLEAMQVLLICLSPCDTLQILAERFTFLSHLIFISLSLSLSLSHRPLHVFC